MFEPLSRAFQEDPEAFDREILELWEAEDHLARTLEARRDAEPFVFYEGPPTANGQPGIHHVLARSLKDTICRYWTMRGRRVERKAGWDTHGLPVELEVEKELGISGKKEIEALGIDRFNEACRNSVFRYKEDWERLSRRIGYLLDYEHPYVTFHPEYIESVWFLLSRFAARGLLYRDHKVLPWCGRCGTGLSSHEVGQGYADLDDPSVWVTFPLREASGLLEDASLVAWTTTPWTLPSNLAVCAHPDLEYAVAETGGRRYLVLAGKVGEILGEEAEVLGTLPGRELEGLAYEPLFPGVSLQELRPGARRHIVVLDPFVTADDGTGLVHLAPYGADDFRIARREDLAVGLAVGEDGRFLTEVGGVPAGTFFKEADRSLIRDLKARGRLLRQATCRHSYPHCWRCDTPLLYFPAPAWFLRTTAYKERMVEGNRRIRWAPSEIGSGRFGEWLENNVDWALSRDRYWGTPLPVWVCERDPEHWICVGSFEELRRRAGGLPEDFDPHRPGVDAIEMPCSEEGCGGTARRVPQVIDCWFDSGAMPCAQHHWPFENREKTAEQFPADFICEGVDQTRGWFYTLHAIAVFLTEVDEELWASGELDGRPLPRLEPGGAYRSVLVNGLLLDKEGRKMSKRLGNRVDPEEALREHGADAIRWSLLSGGAAHLSRRYDDQAIREVRRRVLGTLTASYDFLALYAGVAGWKPSAPRPAPGERPALDRWIRNRAARAAAEAARAFEDLDPAAALKALERFLVEELSNWYIRRNRRRFWLADEGAAEPSAAAAFATLHEVLQAAARMIAPVAPFLAEGLWRRLGQEGSVHLALWPDAASPKETVLGGALEDEAIAAAMDPVLRAVRLGRAVRERVGIRNRQPLSRVLVHVAREAELPASPRTYEDALREELNVKTVEWIEGVPDFLQVRARPDYKRLGRRAGRRMKALAAAIGALGREEIFALQGGAPLTLEVEGESFELAPEDIQVETVEVQGWEAATDGVVTLGLATEITPELEREGLARELINRIQRQRKEQGLEVTDRIRVRVQGSEDLRRALEEWASRIREEVLAEGGLEWCVEEPPGARRWELPGGSCALALEVVAPSRA